VSSSKEPGHTRAVDGPGEANGSGTGDAPPWQRGPAGRTAKPNNHQPRDSSTETQTPRAGSAGGHSPGDAGGRDAGVNRFVAGGSTSSTPTPESDAQPRRDRIETPRPEAYASELPDLSGPTPRPPQRKSERSTKEPGSQPAHASRVRVGTRHKGPVRASMQIRRVDPWSALKVSLVLSIAAFFVWMIAVAFLYLVLGGMGVWSKLNSNVGDLLTSASGQTGGELVSSGTIFGGATLIGLINIVLLTAMATVGAFIYNLTTDLVGGVEVTLADRD
jgi:Transmembrane domain of unknown function (DUF3566)